MIKIYTFNKGEYTESEHDRIFKENPDAGLAVVYTEHKSSRVPSGNRMVWVDTVLTKVAMFSNFSSAQDYIRFLDSQPNRSISDLYIEDRD